MTVIAEKTDAQIKSDVLTELRWDSTVDETEVGVQVKKGIVTLSGSVKSFPKKLAAARAAHRVQGVLDVANELHVDVPSSFQRSDHEIAQAVRSSLKWDVLVPEDQIDSTVTSGRVTLKGEVDTWNERYGAEQAIKHLVGVKDVMNLLTVKRTLIISEQIRRDIEEALERQAEREARQISVAMRDGEVTLSGRVRSWAEKNAIANVARFSPGVRYVTDKTSIDPYH